MKDEVKRKWKANGGTVGLDPLLELLQGMRPRLEKMFRRFHIPSSTAESLLEETLMVMVYRYDQLNRPDRWLLRTLRFRCVRYWQDRQKELLQSIDREISLWLEEEGASPNDLGQRQEQLSDQIDRLPRRCRGFLRRHYGLPSTLDDTGGLDGNGVPSLPLQTHHLERDPKARCLGALMRLLTNDSADA